MMTGWERMHPATIFGTGESVIEIQVPDFPKDPEAWKKEKDGKNQIKRFLFQELQRYTGESPDWGILTGVRPVKLAGRAAAEGRLGSESERDPNPDYYITEEKADLLMGIVKYQGRLLKPSPAEAVGLYIGIPFCPTRCVYCSFPSNQGKAEALQPILPRFTRKYPIQRRI